MAADDAGCTFPGLRVPTLNRVSPGVHCAPGLLFFDMTGRPGPVAIDGLIPAGRTDLEFNLASQSDKGR
jgi:hypothetical protein